MATPTDLQEQAPEIPGERPYLDAAERQRRDTAQASVGRSQERNYRVRDNPPQDNAPQQPEATPSGSEMGPGLSTPPAPTPSGQTMRIAPRSLTDLNAAREYHPDAYPGPAISVSRAMGTPRDYTPPEDWGLKRAFNNLKAAGQQAQDTLASLQTVPGVGGLLQLLGTVGGIATAEFGLPALTSESGRRGAMRAYRTLEGGEPGIADIPAYARALTGAREARAGELAQTAESETASPWERGVAALGQFFYGALPNIAPVKLLPEGVRGAREAARPRMVAAAGEDIPKEPAVPGEPAPEVPPPEDIAARAGQPARIYDPQYPRPLGGSQATPGTSRYLGKRAEVSTSTGIETGTVIDKFPDSEHYVIQLENGRRIVSDRFRLVVDDATAKAADDATLDRSLQVATKQRAETTVTKENYLSPEDAAKYAKTTPLSERNEAVRQATGINPSRLDPTVAAELGEAVKRDPAAFAGNRRVVPDPELLQKTARTMGMSTEAFTKALTDAGFNEPGDVAALVVGANVRVAELISDYTRARAGGNVETAAVAYADLTKFATKIGGANSELGRALRALQIGRSLELVGALRQREVVSRASRELKDAQAAVEKAGLAAVKAKPELADRAKTQFVSQTERAEKARVQYETARDRLVALGEKAKTEAYLRAVRDRADDPGVAAAIAALDPTDTVGLATVISRMHKYTAGDLLVSASLSGAYSGPLGHIRSAVGAGLNAIDELALGDIAALVHAPGFERGEIKASLFGVAEALRTFPAMTGRFWKNRVSPEIMMGEERAIEGRGPQFRGIARPLGVMLEGHGYYHSVGTHFVSTIETYRLAMNRAIKEAGSGASSQAIGDRYTDLLTNLPDDLVHQANRVALDRRYIAKQSKVAESVLDLVGTRFGPGQLKAAWLRPLFVAARFGIGFAGRETEMLGGGLIRAAKMGIGDVRTIQREAIRQESRLRAVQELGPDASAFDLYRKAFELAKSPSKELRADAMRKIAPERNYIIREASMAGIRGTVGAGLLGWGIYQYGQGNLRRNGFETDLKTPLGEINVTWLMPYAAPLVFASIIGDQTMQGTHDDPAQVAQSVVGAARALMQNVVDSDSLFTVTLIDDILAGKADKKVWQQLGQVTSRLLVPGFSVAARELDRSLDTTAKDPRSWSDYIAYYMPLARRALRPKIDLYTGDPQPEQPMGAQRFNPFGVAPAGGRTVSNTPVALEDRRLAKALPADHKSTLDVTRLSPTWGTGENAVKLGEERAYEVERVTAQYRNETLAALLSSEAYGKATDAEKDKLWKKAEESSRRQARRDLAVKFAGSGDPRDTAKFIRAAYDANGKGREETALWALQLDHSGQLTPPLRAALNDLVTTTEKATHSIYTLDTYLKVAPDVQRYLGMRPFNIGDPQEWDELESERSELSAITRQQGDKAAQAYRRAHPLIARYERSDAANGARAAFLAKHPEIKNFVSNSTYKWLR